MDQIDFDFDNFRSRVTDQQQRAHAEAAQGLEAMEHKLAVLEGKIAAMEEERLDLEAKVSQLRAFLQVEKPLHDSAPRVRGIQAAVQDVFSDMPPNQWLSFEAVVELVQGTIPEAREDSIQAALRILVKRGELHVSGKRGSRQWAVIEVVIDVERQEVQATHKRLEAPPTSSRPRPQDVAQGVVDVMNTWGHHHTMIDAEDMEEGGITVLRDSLCNEILAELERRPEGLDAKAVAWLMDRLGAEESDFMSAVQMLLNNGDIEETQGDNGIGCVIRLAVDPESKEGLKRAKIEGRSLFAGADRPDHA